MNMIVYVLNVQPALRWNTNLLLNSLNNIINITMSDKIESNGSDGCIEIWEKLSKKRKEKDDD